jgi:coenzyme PQQ biosynthesis protein PqqD
MDINKNKKVVLAADYLLEKFDNEITVYHPSLTTSIYLNETGGVIWELCNGQRTVAEIIALLQEEYPENREQIEEGVIDIISSLLDKNIATLI